jgi:hypothetical protein
MLVGVVGAHRESAARACDARRRRFHKCAGRVARQVTVIPVLTVDFLTGYPCGSRTYPI